MKEQGDMLNVSVSVLYQQKPDYFLWSFQYKASLESLAIGRRNKPSRLPHLSVPGSLRTRQFIKPAITHERTFHRTHTQSFGS